MINSELGNIQIFFGEVVDIADPTQMLRCRVAIHGKTDQIEKEKLPWYFSWNGLNSLPSVGDKVPVIIFDGNISTGFYGSVLITGSVQTQGNYKDYVQVFKKSTANCNASIDYSISNGLEIRNDKVGVNANTAKLKLFCESNSISMTQDGISLGTDGLEAMLMGDKTVDFLKQLMDYIQQVVKMMYAGFQTVMVAAAPNPFTSAIGAALTPFVPGEMQLTTLLLMLKSKLNSIQSKNVYNS